MKYMISSGQKFVGAKKLACIGFTAVFMAFGQSAAGLPLPKLKPEATAASGFNSIAATQTQSGAQGIRQTTGAEQPKQRLIRSVVDQAQILTDDSEIRLSKALAQFQKERKVQVVVLTTASLRGHDIHTYTQAVSSQWKIANNVQKPGVLVVVAPNEKFVKILVGPGLENWMPDEVSNHLISKFMVPAFRQSDWQGGVVRGTAGIIAVLGRDTPIQLNELAPNANVAMANPAAAPQPAQNTTAAQATDAPANVAAAASNGTSTNQPVNLVAAQAKPNMTSSTSVFMWPLLLLLLAMGALGMFWFRGRQIEDLSEGAAS